VFEWANNTAAWPRTGWLLLSAYATNTGSLGRLCYGANPTWYSNLTLNARVVVYRGQELSNVAYTIQPTGRVDCILDTMAGLDAAHGRHDARRKTVMATPC
jgi:hypothetical protein